MPGSKWSRSVPKFKTVAKGRYIVGDILGEGGVARVHRGYDRRTGTNCAIKLLLPTLRRYPRIRDRFEREAEVLLSLKHDHIVELFDHGVTDNHHWLAMELITGGSLVQRVRDNGPMDADSVIQLGIEACDALQFAHERGIIHRDIKPGNILMDAEGRTKIVDFGIAHVNDASKVLTRVGVKMGSVRFMAPEQRTDASSVGAPADIYGLGITLMSVLLGRTPKKPDEDLISLKGLIPSTLSYILLRATLPDIGSRFSTASEMGQMLRDIDASTHDTQPDN